MLTKFIILLNGSLDLPLGGQTMSTTKLFFNGGHATRLPTCKLKFQIFPTSYYISTMHFTKQMVCMLLIDMPWYKKLMHSDILLLWWYCHMYNGGIYIRGLWEIVILTSNLNIFQVYHAMQFASLGFYLFLMNKYINGRKGFLFSDNSNKMQLCWYDMMDSKGFSKVVFFSRCYGAVSFNPQQAIYETERQ